VAYWQGDPASLDLVLPDPEQQVFAAAGMTPMSADEDLEAWAWWDALGRVPPMEETAAHRKAIGDAGEELSFEYERKRLKQEGFPRLADRVRWVARESPAYGFDILSFFGRPHGDGVPENQLAIEVKANALTARGSFFFFLTEHEWRTAHKLGKQYVFHFWDGVTPGATPIAAREAPIVIEPAKMAEHLPQTPICKEQCGWKTAFLMLEV
jgi:hypothetical protein